MRARFRSWGWQFLIALDQLAHVLICFATYVVLGRGDCPVADETISSRVGRAAVLGKRWALLLETVIDRLFVALGDKPGHCRRSIGA